MDKCNSQERIFMIVNFLYKDHVAGLTNKELARLVGTSEANICRDMAVFEKFQWVNRNNNARWRLSPTFAGIAGKLMRSYQTAKLLLSEEEAKYATAMQ